MLNQKLLERFAARCRRSAQRPALILGASVNGLSYVRSLGRRGVPVLCGNARVDVASKSRFGSFVLLEPEPGDDLPGEAAADRLIAALNDRGIRPVVFASADDWQVYVAQRDSAGNPGFVSLAPDLKAIERIVDKQAQYEFASGMGIAVPPFANARAVQEGTAAWHTYPAIVKPRWSHFGRKAIGGKAVRVASALDLTERLDELSRIIDIGDYIVQAVIDGRDDCLYAYLGCFDGAGREFSWVMKRKLRQYPPMFGDGSLDVTCAEEPIVEPARKLLAAMRYRGLVGIEFKKDPHTGEFSLIEINPRTVSTNQLAITAGVDFPWHAYQLAIHGGSSEQVGIPTAERMYRIGVQHVHEEREFLSFLGRRHRGETKLMEWLGCVLRAQSYAIWSRSDPWPFFWTVKIGLQRKLRRWWFKQAVRPEKADVAPSGTKVVPAERSI